MLKEFYNTHNMLIAQDTDIPDIFLPNIPFPLMPVDPDLDGTDIWTPQPG